MIDNCVFIDFEYNGTTEQRFNLVACCFSVDGRKYEVWLHKDEDMKTRLKNQLKKYRDTHFMVAFNAVAEASSFISLGLDPTKFQWIDLQLEYKMLINHNHTYAYGKQLIDGKVRHTSPPPEGFENRNEKEQLKQDRSKPQKSLAACTFRMLDRKIDTEEKNEMRDLIISAPDTFTETERTRIVEYCTSDIVNLPDLKDALFKAHSKSFAGILKDSKYTIESIAWRGECAARTAMMMQIGYPVNREKVEKFAAAVPDILKDIAQDINTQFPDQKYFVWNKPRNAYTMKQKPLREWIVKAEMDDKWLRTDTDALSLSLKAWTKFYSYSHDYPRGNLPAQVLRYLKTKQNLNGFLPASGKKKKSFFDSYGTDDRARAWLNPYGSSTSRFQPSATSYIPLKAAWMRALIEPKPGMSICGIDYGSEEFLLSAIMSKDKNMYDSYASGDPYLYFAKLTGAVPMDGKKEEYTQIRTAFKSTVLGISYSMAKYSLSKKLSEDTRTIHTSGQAQKLINQFFEVYSDYKQFVDSTRNDYAAKGFLSLLDSYIMLSDNANERSVSNFKIQGAGACILRKAIQLAQLKGLAVILPLHDALYIEFPSDKPEQIDILVECMQEAFSFFFTSDPTQYQWSKSIRLDIDVWGPDQVDGSLVTPKGWEAKTQKIYIDPRSKSEYERFSKYF